MIIPTSTFATALLVFSVYVDAEILDRSFVSKGVDAQHPKLSAVTVRSQLKARGEAFKPKTDCIHEYAEGKS